MVASQEYVENTISVFAQATEASWNTAGREGSVIELTREMAADVMITGDLHGHRRNFNLIQRTAALDEHPQRHLVLQEICHGGPRYPDNGGCMSHAVLEDVARLKVQFPDRVHFLLGNHELAELAEYPIQKNRQMLNLLFRLGLQQMYGPATDRVREAMMFYLASCPLAVRLPGGVFVSHSIPEHLERNEFDASVFSRRLTDADFADRAGVFSLVWGRDYRQQNAQAFAEMVGAEVLINGHEPCPEGCQAPNDVQVIVDCCNDVACYVILPTDREVGHAEVLQRVQKLA